MDMSPQILGPPLQLHVLPTEEEKLLPVKIRVSLVPIRLPKKVPIKENGGGTGGEKQTKDPLGAIGIIASVLIDGL